MAKSGLRGSVFYRPGNLPYVVSFPLPSHLDERDPETGKRRYKKLPTERYPDEASATARLIEINHQYRTGTLAAPDRQLLSDYLDEWLATKTHLAFNSQRIYRTDCNLIRRHLGRLELKAIDTLQIERWHADMREDDSVSTYAAHHAHRRLSQALRAAERAGRIPYNPAARVTAPKHVPKRHDAWQPEEARQFVAYLTSESVPAVRVLGPSFWLTMLATGIRVSEGLSLRWDDLELPATGSGALTVQSTGALVERTVYTVKDHPKTASSVRRIPIPESVVAALRIQRATQNEQRLKMGSHWQDNGLVWARYDGSIIRPGTAHSQFKSLAAAAGLPGIPIHGLRATCASLMQEEGVPVVTAQSILGHEDPSTTLKIYTRPSETSKRDAVERLDRFLRGVN